MCVEIRKKPRVLTAITVSESAVLVKTQLSGVRAGGFDVLLCSSRGEEVERMVIEENLKFRPVQMCREPNITSDLWSLFNVLRILFVEKPDIINAGTPKAGFLFTIAGFITRTKVRIYHIRGFRHESLYGARRSFQVFIERLTCLLATHVICLSPSVKQKLLEERICAPSKAVVLGDGGSGTILDKFCPEEFTFSDKMALRSRYNIGRDDLVFGYVGRLVERKGIYELVDAWQRLNKEVPSAKLLLVGPYESAQPLLPEYTEIIERDDSIILVGRQDNVAPFLSIMDVFCLPAHWEGFGNVLIEAAAMGVPVVSTWGTGTRDAVSDGYNGTLCPVGDRDALLRSMLEYSASTELRMRHGKNGREWAKRFDRKTVIENLVDFYEKVL